MRWFKIHITLWALLVAMTGFSQVHRDTLNQIDAKGRKQGNWMKRDNQEILIYTGTFIDDKPTGKFVYYYPKSNKIKAISIFDHKRNTAITKVFSKTGKRLMEGKVWKELRDSTWVYYDERDSVIAIENYYHGKKDGAFKTFFKNGKLLELKTYKNDSLNGRWIKYYDNGLEKENCMYKNNLHHGKATFYFPSGKVDAEGIYLNDLKDGWWEFYNASGEMEWRINYKKSNAVTTKRINGLEELFYPSGMPQSKINYSFGMKSGHFVEYYDKGEIQITDVPSHDVFPADKKQVFVGQKIQREGNYYNDKLNGKITYYKEDGSIDRVEIYKMGVLENGQN